MAAHKVLAYRTLVAQASTSHNGTSFSARVRVPVLPYPRRTLYTPNNRSTLLVSAKSKAMAMTCSIFTDANLANQMIQRSSES